MIVATFSVHNDRPRISPKAPGLGSRRWLVKLYAQDEQQRITRELRPEQRCYLMDLLPLAHTAADELLAELDWTVTDAGYQVVALR